MSRGEHVDIGGRKAAAQEGAVVDELVLPDDICIGERRDSPAQDLCVLAGADQKQAQLPARALPAHPLPGIQKEIEPLDLVVESPMPGCHAGFQRNAELLSRFATIGRCPALEIDRVEESPDLPRRDAVACANSLCLGLRGDDQAGAVAQREWA